MNTVVNIPSSMSHLSPPQVARDHGQSAERAAAPWISEPKYSPDNSNQYSNSPHSKPHETSADPGQYSPFIPMLLGALALLGWLGFQTLQLSNEREVLKVAYASQQQTVDNAGKLRTSLDALASDTQRMADKGNPSAKLLVDELRQRGVTINTTASNPAIAAPIPER